MDVYKLIVLIITKWFIAQLQCGP
uniref:Uncharacterized protein n=1 Tax=Anguilla anguilla TaxID=7936 RepID=A0A0E9PF57_ANGAN